MDSSTSQTPRVSIQLVLADTSPAVLDAWRQQFATFPDVEIHDADFLQVDADALLVPGNSFGFLDGGVELRVSEALGIELQDRLRARIRSEFGGELLVGQALIDDETPSGPAVLYAPIWRTPQPIAATVNVFLAVSAALSALGNDARPEIKRVAAPSMGVESGGLHPFVSARQMRYGYETGTGARGRGAKNLTRLIRRERKLKSIPGAAQGDADGAENDTGA